MMWLVETVNYDVIILFIICVLLCFSTWFLTQYLDLKWLISYRYIGTSVYMTLQKYRYIGSKGLNSKVIKVASSALLGIFIVLLRVGNFFFMSWGYFLKRIVLFKTVEVDSLA